MRARVMMAVGLVALMVGAVSFHHAGSQTVAADVGDTLAQGPGPVPKGADRPSASGVRPVLSRPPNIVLVLMDDFSMDLLPTMRHAREMRHRGASYSHAFVVDSLCCVSRTSLLTGQYPHQTGVLTNTANTPNAYGPIGGWEAFTAYGNEARSVNVRLQKAGYTTGFVGKFLNQYEVRDGIAPAPPAGWDDWRVIFGAAYDGWGFRSTYVEDGQVRLRDHPTPWFGASDEEKDAAHVGTVTEEMALDFLRTHRDDEAPYYLQVAPYAPHSRVGPVGAYPGDPMFPPAFRDRPSVDQPHGDCGPVRCDRLTVRDLPGFDDDQTDNLPRYGDGSVATDWKGGAPGLPAAAARDSLRNRARMVQSIDRMLGRILESVGDDTYVVLTSDNGFHLGQHGLGRGKGAPYDSDAHVPLVVVGPDVVPGVRREVVSNIDLAPTFEDLAGLRPAPYRAGASLAPTLTDPRLDRRGLTFFEHTWAPSLGFDPDLSYSGGTIDRIPSYLAVRSRDALLVRLDLDHSWEGTDHAWEFYDYRDALFEQTNSFADPAKQSQIRLLRSRLEEFERCQRITRGEAFPDRCRSVSELPVG